MPVRRRPERSGRAEVQPVLRRAGQVVVTTGDVRTAVDDRDRDGAAAVVQRHLGAARQRLVGHAERALIQRAAAGGPVPVEAGAVPRDVRRPVDGHAAVGLAPRRGAEQLRPDLVVAQTLRAPGRGEAAAPTGVHAGHDVPAAARPLGLDEHRTALLGGCYRARHGVLAPREEVLPGSHAQLVVSRGGGTGRRRSGGPGRRAGTGGGLNEARAPQGGQAGQPGDDQCTGERPPARAGMRVHWYSFPTLPCGVSCRARACVCDALRPDHRPIRPIRCS